MEKIEKDWIRFELSYPIPIEENGKIRKQHYIDIELFKAKHLLLLPEQFRTSEVDLTVDNIVPLITVLSGLSEESTKEILIKDIKEISKTINDFL